MPPVCGGDKYTWMRAFTPHLTTANYLRRTAITHKYTPKSALCGHVCVCVCVVWTQSWLIRTKSQSPALYSNKDVTMKTLRFMSSGGGRVNCCQC